MRAYIPSEIVFSFLQLSSEVYPLIISLKTEKLLDDNLTKIIESLDMRLYKTYNTGILADLYDNIITKIKGSSNPNQVENEIRAFIDNKRPNPVFATHLYQVGYNHSAAKYILWEYDFAKHPNAMNNNDYKMYNSMIVEHIFRDIVAPFPFPNIGSEFQDAQDYQKHIHLFGNLCLLTSQENSKVKLLNPQAKAVQYIGFTSPQVRDLGARIQNRGFIKTDINTETETIVEWCLNRWK